MLGAIISGIEAIGYRKKNAFRITIARPQVQKKLGGVSLNGSGDVSTAESENTAVNAVKKLYDTHGSVYTETLGVRRK